MIIKDNLRAMTLNKHIVKLLPVAFILIYLVLALIKIKYPGVHYDEILFGNAAIGGVDDVFITYKIGQFPILLMKYIGAMKAYIYYPIFKMFGISAYSIRIPGILATAFALYVLYAALKKYFTDNIALLSLFLLTIDASFISLSRYDVGPTIIEFLIMSIVLYFFVKYKHSYQVKYLFFIFFAFSVGLFNKLNFIWFINSFYIAAIIVYWNAWVELLGKKSRLAQLGFAVGAILSYLIFVGYFFFINAVYDLSRLRSLRELIPHVEVVLFNLKDLITGESFYNYAIGVIHTKLNNIYFLLILMLVASGLTLYLLSDKIVSYTKRSYFFFLCLFIMSLLQVLITKVANNIWHVNTVYCLFIILLSASISLILDHFSWKSLRFLGYILVIIIATHHLIMDYKYVQAYDKPVKSVYWSKKIYDLIEYTKNDPHQFASIDWGIHTQLTDFTGLRQKYYELSFSFNNMNLSPQNTQELIAEVTNSKYHFYYITHSEADTFFKTARINFFKLVSEKVINVALVKTISDDDGRVVFEIYAPETVKVSKRTKNPMFLRKPYL